MNDDLVINVTENSKIYLDDSSRDYWKIGFTITCQIQDFFLKNGISIQTIHNADPWDFESECEMIWNNLQEYHDDQLEFDEIMDNIILLWKSDKIRRILSRESDPLGEAFNTVSTEFDKLQTLSRKEKLGLETEIIKQICIVLGRDGETFYLPTRKVSRYFGAYGQNRSHQYIAQKIRFLVDKEKFLIEVSKRTKQRSPRYVLNSETFPS